MRNRTHTHPVRAPRRLPVPSDRAGKTAVWAAIGLLCLVWAQYLRPHALGGRAGYVLVSGQSMEPRYHTGDLVLVLRRKAYRPGDVVAYRVPKGDAMAGAQVIHRIVGGDATHGFVVRGDNRTAPDVWRPKPDDVVGAEVLRIPDAVLVLRFLRSPLLLALLAASFVFVRALAREESKRDEPRVDDASLARHRLT